MLHILERFFLHFVASTFLTLAFFFALRLWVRCNLKVRAWIPTQKRSLLTIAGLLVFALFPLREPFDIWAGNNSFLKSCFDQISWLLGPAVAVWGLTRFDTMEDL